MTRRFAMPCLGAVAALWILGLAAPSNAKPNLIGRKACMDDCGKYGANSNKFQRCADFCECVHDKGKGNVYCSIKSTTDNPARAINEPSRPSGSNIRSRTGRPQESTGSRIRRNRER